MQFKVKYAKLHTEYFSNGTGNLGTVLGDSNKHLGMDMLWTQYGLFVSYKGVHFTVPLSNLAGCTFAEKPNLALLEPTQPAVRPLQKANG